MKVFLFVCLLYFFDTAWCVLWSKGIVHYDINSKDYDLHSQDVIMSTFAQLERELCVKFFHTPMNYTSNNKEKILYVNNPDKRKACPPEHYDYNSHIVNMVVGYKCINQREIARIVVDMLKSSVEQNDTPINSYDLIKTFQDKKFDTAQQNLLPPADRNYINAHYHKECGNLYSRPIVVGTRRSGDEPDAPRLSEENEEYYRDKIWPLGVVMYTVEPKIRGTKAHAILKHAMTSIELKSCVVFQFHDLEGDKVLVPKNMLIFSHDGEEVPYFGFKNGNQTIKLSAMAEGAPAHTAHALNALMRVLGVPMMSSRYDRDNYVIVHWKNVLKGKEHLLEKLPEAAWLKFIPYDFDSVTHASANFACGVCELGATSVQPIQESLWQRTLSMGHKTVLSQTDVQMLKQIYGKECEKRFMTKNE